MAHYDFIALGGGNAGLTAAKAVKAARSKVALVDPTPIGGLCALAGCNPKKVLVRAVDVLETVRTAGAHGIDTGQAQIDWARVIERKHSFTDEVTPRTESGLEEAGVEYVRAHARFSAPDRLELDGRIVTFDGVLIATGSSPRRLTFPGADHVITSDQLLEMTTPPARLVVIGAGVVAAEFAHIFARLGSTVHVVNRGERALKSHDADIAACLTAHLETLGVVFHHGTEPSAVVRNPTSYDVRLSDGRTLGADAVLNAAGRPPNVEGLGMEAAGVRYSAHGVAVNAYLRSPDNPRVFAAGDAHGERELSPVASYEGALVAHNFLEGDTRRVEYDMIPSAIYTVPPLATVGLTEHAARERGLDVEVSTHELSDWTVYRLAGKGPAHGKVITERSTGRIVGAHLFAPAADESIHVFAIAMRFGLTKEKLSEMIYAYPTLTSAMKYL